MADVRDFAAALAPVPAPKEADAGSVGDEELLRRYGEGEARAFDILVDRSWSRLYSVAWSIARDPALAEDAAQRGLCRLARRPSACKRHVQAWLVRAVINEAKNLLRDERTRRRYERSASPPAAEATEDGVELRALLDRLVLELPEKLRVPLALHFADGLTHDDAARVLRLPKGTVSSRIRRALQTLRSRLGQLGYGALTPMLLQGLEASGPVPLAPAGAAIRALAGAAGATRVAAWAAAAVAAIALVTVTVLPTDDRTPRSARSQRDADERRVARSDDARGAADAGDGRSDERPAREPAVSEAMAVAPGEPQSASIARAREGAASPARARTGEERALSGGAADDEPDRDDVPKPGQVRIHVAVVDPSVDEAGILVRIEGGDPSARSLSVREPEALVRELAARRAILTALGYRPTARITSTIEAAFGELVSSLVSAAIDAGFAHSAVTFAIEAAPVVIGPRWAEGHGYPSARRWDQLGLALDLVDDVEAFPAELRPLAQAAWDLLRDPPVDLDGLNADLDEMFDAEPEHGAALLSLLRDVLEVQLGLDELPRSRRPALLADPEALVLEAGPFERELPPDSVREAMRARAAREAERLIHVDVGPETWRARAAGLEPIALAPDGSAEVIADALRRLAGAVEGAQFVEIGGVPGDAIDERVSRIRVAAQAAGLYVERLFVPYDVGSKTAE